MRNRLIDYMREQKNVSVYTDADNIETFINGYVVGVDDHDFLLCSYTPNGAYDGYILRPVDDVFQIQVDTKYNAAMVQLIGGNVLRTEFSVKENESLLSAFLQWAKTEEMVVSVRLFEADSMNISGYVEDVNQDTCLLRLLDFYGQEDGKTVVDIECITEVYGDTDDEQRLKKLNKISG